VARRRASRREDAPGAEEAQTIVWAPTAIRGNERKWRLHACACARHQYPPRAARKWLRYLHLAELYADGELSLEEFDAARIEFDGLRKPRLGPVSGDFSLALSPGTTLTQTWQNVVIAAGREYHQEDHLYPLVLGRFRILRDLIGPAPLPAFDPALRTETVMALARDMYQSSSFGNMAILADALQDAGCHDPVILTHCLDPEQVHYRGCWLVDLVLGTGDLPKKMKRSPRSRSRGTP
jgi:hypothetical protein